MPTEQHEAPPANYFDRIYGQMIEEVKGMFPPPPNVNQPAWIEMQKLVFNARTEFGMLHDLYKAVLIPQVFAFGEMKKAEAQRSQFASMIDCDYEGKSDLEELLRLGYVHLYHKYEAYRDNVFEVVDRAYGGVAADSTKKLVERYYGKNLDKEIVLSPTLAVVVFVCNCVKHTAGIPKPQRGVPLPDRYAGADVTMPLVIAPDDLLNDMKEMRMFTVQFWFAMSTVHNRRWRERDYLASGFASLPLMRQEIVKAKYDEAVAHCDLVLGGLLKHIPPKRR